MAMSCDFDRIDALLDGSLPEDERASVLAHMHTCSACRAYYEVMAGLEGDETVPVGFSQRVMERVRATPQKAARRIPYGKILSAVAACAVLVVSLQLLPSLGFGTADESAESISMKIVPESQFDAYTADDAMLPVYTVSDEAQCASIRQWLRDNAFPALYGENAEREAYDLTAADVAALNQAVPGLDLPEQMLQLELKSAK